jgi:DNA-binding MarR family transcriptional regulator
MHCTTAAVTVLNSSGRDARSGAEYSVSDISEMLDVTRPGITKVLGDLDGMGYITKTRDTTDSRVVYVSLTEKGWRLYRAAVEDYHQQLSKVLAEISDEDVQSVCDIIHRAMELISQDTANRNAKAFRK